MRCTLWKLVPSELFDTHRSVLVKLVSGDKVRGEVHLCSLLLCLGYQLSDSLRALLIKQGVANL